MLYSLGQLKPRYHTRRLRDSCIGAGHTHCLFCDKAIAMGRNDYQDAQIPILCFYCKDKYENLKTYEGIKEHK